MSKIRNWSKLNALVWVNDNHNDVKVRIHEAPSDGYHTYHVYRTLGSSKMLIAAQSNINKARADASHWMRRHPHG